MDENESPLETDNTDVTGRLQSESASGRRHLRLKVVAAVSVGALVFSGIGLAAADVLPAPAQDVAHQALGRVGVHVPPGHQRFADPAVCPGGPYRNHGAYVRTHKDDPDAGPSPCGKPVKAVEHPGAKDNKDDTTEVNERPDGAGPPPWAHGNGKEKGKKNDKQNERSKEKADEPDEDHAPHTSTSTTIASTTTTSAPAPTTTTTTP